MNEAILHDGARPMAVSTDGPRILFLYWGRRGGVNRMALDIARAAVHDKVPNVFFALAQDNELRATFAQLPLPILWQKLFSSAREAVLGLARLGKIRRELVDFIRRHRIDHVIVLIPHVWSPFVAKAIKATGARLYLVCHDAQRHPGDLTGFIDAWLRRDLRRADAIISLSRAVTALLTQEHRIAPDRIVQSFLPLIDDVSQPVAPRTSLHHPPRLVFLGRVRAYKGLTMMLDALQILQARGIAFDMSIFGEGDMGADAERLAGLGVVWHRGWVQEQDIAGILARQDVMILSHTEASQSGSVMLAHGAGIPAIVTPVGGLPEQIEAGRNGLVAKNVSAESLAEAIAMLIGDDALFRRMSAQIVAERDARSPSRLLDQMRRLAADARPART
ncbi:glycosyltransferase family 4 protein [Methylovirgula sp. 4M-Z18]|uniref:glycosyltransferase family 4 protein n=1 Tax=Methylovirgula sp. 4M-Z18 TaxID=2293567 RepID=UPI0013145297|nr:glycosyltransferase family 4 protein [Methylovirgula sp. 4M-Z18]